MVVDRIHDFGQPYGISRGQGLRKYDQVVDDSVSSGAGGLLGRLTLQRISSVIRDDRVAFLFRGENVKSAQMTYAELYTTVARLAKSLREIGIRPGDRIAGYMPNLIETAVAMLAATSVGAVWSSCATDIGAGAALDRLGQIEPKVLFTVDGYFYKGKPFSTLGNAAEVAKAIPSLNRVVVVSYAGYKPDISAIPGAVHYEDFLAMEEPVLGLNNYPLTIPYSLCSLQNDRQT
jgi:acetoacetyl-CoA synthetase